MKRFHASLIAVLALAGGCRSVEPLPLDPVEAKKIIAAAVPKGTAVEVATKTMEQRGFRCRTITPHGNDETFLYCYTPGPGTIVFRRWAVTFTAINGKVGEGRVSSDLVGP